jgi:hypothetical protein
VRAELLGFYSDPGAPYDTKRRPKEWARVQTQLEELKNLVHPQPVQHAAGSDRARGVPSE